MATFPTRPTRRKPRGVPQSNVSVSSRDASPDCATVLRHTELRHVPCPLLVLVVGNGCHMPHGAGFATALVLALEPHPKL